METGLLEREIELIERNNRDRMIETGSPPPAEHEEDHGEGRDREYHIEMTCFEKHGSSFRSRFRWSSTRIQVMESELKFPLNVFLAYTVVHNPNFVSDSDTESFDEVFGDALYNEARKIRLPNISEGETREEKYRILEMYENKFARQNGFRNEQEELQHFKSFFSKPFMLFYEKSRYDYDLDIAHTRRQFRRDAIEYRIPLDVPIRDLRMVERLKKHVGLICSFVVAEETVGLAGHGYVIP